MTGATPTAKVSSSSRRSESKAGGPHGTLGEQSGLLWTAHGIYSRERAEKCAFAKARS